MELKIVEEKPKLLKLRCRLCGQYFFVTVAPDILETPYCGKCTSKIRKVIGVEFEKGINKNYI